MLGKDQRAESTLRRQNLLAVEIALGDLQDLLEYPVGISSELSELIRFSPPIPGSVDVEEPTHARFLPNLRVLRGKVLIGIVDVGGFDFSHPDFGDE